MTPLRSTKFRVGFGIFAALVLILVVGGFAMSRGYLMHFLLDDQTISRDQFFQLAQDAATDTSIHVGCAQGDWTVGWFYVYESHCFTSDAALDTYMKQHFGSSS